MNELNISTELTTLLFLSTLITSAFTAVLGQGGGLLLMGVLAQVIPAAVIIPIHAAIQTASNSSRAYISLKYIKWAIISPILIGIFLGAIIVTPLISHINWQWMQLIIGLYILWSVWSKGLHLKKDIPFSLTGLGIAQGSLGVLLGATGPLGSATLLDKGLNRDQLIASNAVIMLTSHVVKILVFLLTGFVFSAYFNIVLLLSFSAILGSYMGKYLRPKLSEILFFRIFRVLLTILALRMIYLGCLSF